jgi:hypothetical protein
MPEFQVSFKKVDNTLKIREIFLLSSCGIHFEQQFLLSYEMERYKICSRPTGRSSIFFWNFTNNYLLMDLAMGMFHRINSLVVDRNHWLILFSKIRLFISFVKHASKLFSNC